MEKNQSSASISMRNISLQSVGFWVSLQFVASQSARTSIPTPVAERAAVESKRAHFSLSVSVSVRVRERGVEGEGKKDERFQ